MRFRLFGTDVEVQLSYLFTTLMLTVLAGQRDHRASIVFVVVSFVSILVHEFGHVLAVRRHGLEPVVVLHSLGGLTIWRDVLPLRRRDYIFISLAGPFAGFAFGGLAVAVEYGLRALGVDVGPYGRVTFAYLRWINFIWGFVNLLPVLPFDGGNVLDQALGPKRIRLSSAISGVVGALVAALFWRLGMAWGTMLFAVSAFGSFQRYRNAAELAEAGERVRKLRGDRGDEVSQEVRALLVSARSALEAENWERARRLALEALEASAGGSADGARQSLEIVAWAMLRSGEGGPAREVAERAAKLGPLDPVLQAELLRDGGDLDGARKILEAARAAGEGRKEVAGPLIQILIEQGQVPRAAAVAFDVVEQLSEDDIRQMGRIAFDASSFDWAARLFEAAFQRQGSSEDAYDAARALARFGALDKALDLLERAVNAGFSDRARAWSDSALERLHGDKLAHLLPPP